MDKKLENGKVAESSIVEEVPETPFEMDDMEEFDDDIQVDEDGNFIIDDDEPDEDEEEDIEESDDEDIEADEEIESEPEQVKSAKAKRKLSPAEIKLVALKKENQELKRKMREKQEKKEADNLVAKYVDEGYDEDTAKRYALQDVETNRLKKEVELLRFERENAKVFERYPQAAEQAEEIMEKSKLSGLTVEQVCRAMFTRDMPDYEKRALKAAKGESVREVNSKTAGGTQYAEDIRDTLTREDRAYIRAVEKAINRGKPLSKEEVEIVLKRRK
ncbi:MAG: hypothetical protein WC194_12070 [Mesotoga sp.]|uniref:hypothetical protein n=1 Tax=Mesotoga sp. TaxID=2053577 RepID=UPI003566C55E